MLPILTVLACFISIAGYATYFLDIRKSNIEPNRYSWLIWSFSIGLEALTYNDVSGDLLKSACFIIPAMACIFITGKIWLRSSAGKASLVDLNSLAFSIIALIVYILFESSLLAHLVLVVALPVAFIPTIKGMLYNPDKENSFAWYLWVIADVLTLGIIVARFNKAEELPYIITELVCHAAVVAVLYIGKKRKNAAAESCVIKINRLGKAVYTERFIPKGEVVMKFGGEQMSYESIRQFLGSKSDHYLQVGTAVFLGPSGEKDDFVNHSCNPNTGIITNENGVYLVALKNIPKNTELTWDYSTCSYKTGWEMNCKCNQPGCRGLITGFELLDHNTKRKYLDLGIVASYITQDMYQTVPARHAHGNEMFSPALHAAV